jgi:signal transduction histidine kinase
MTRRILATVVGVTIVAIGAFFIPAALAIHSARDRGELLELQREASVVASRVPSVGPIDASVLDPVGDSTHPLALYGPDGKLLGGVGPSIADPITTAALGGDFAEGRIDGDLVAAVPVRTLVDGSNLVVRIEAPGSESRARFLRAMAELGGVAVLIIGLSALGATAVARRLNRPIDDLRVWASDSSSDRPPPEPTGIAELDALREELIVDRERIRDLLARERSFSSQVSHQLRTPVAAMRVAVETELDAPRDDPTDLLDEVLGELDRLESTIAGLLALARHDRRPVERVTLDAVARTAADAHRPRIADGRTITVAGDRTEVDTDGVAVEHVVDVLVDNALRHGRGDVRLVVDRDDALAWIDVADDGERPTDRDVFAEGSGDRGHGIGLRLARTLAESVGGSLTLLDTATTTFRLALPGDRHLTGDRPVAHEHPLPGA